MRIIAFFAALGILFLSLLLSVDALAAAAAPVEPSRRPLGASPSPRVVVGHPQKHEQQQAPQSTHSGVEEQKMLSFEGCAPGVKMEFKAALEVEAEAAAEAAVAAERQNSERAAAAEKIAAEKALAAEKSLAAAAAAAAEKERSAAAAAAAAEIEALRRELDEARRALLHSSGGSSSSAAEVAAAAVAMVPRGAIVEASGGGSGERSSNSSSDVQSQALVVAEGRSSPGHATVAEALAAAKATVMATMTSSGEGGSTSNGGGGGGGISSSTAVAAAGGDPAVEGTVRAEEVLRALNLASKALTGRGGGRRLVTVLVGTEQELKDAVAELPVLGDYVTIEVKNDITLTQVISIPYVTGLVINGNGYTIGFASLDSGNGRCFETNGGDVTMIDLTIRNGYAVR